MLPEKRKNLIILIISIIAIILVIIIMYNFAKFMRGAGETEEKVFDDPYPNTYTYYGFITDEDGNYQLMGLDSEFNETLLGLRSFYNMSNLYYYNNHLVMYSDAINQINYNATEENYFLYELNPFYSNATDVLITPAYYVFYTEDTLEYCPSADCNRAVITDSLLKPEVFSIDNKVFYQLQDGVYEFDLETLESRRIVLNETHEITLLTVSGKYLVFIVDDIYWIYNSSSKVATSLEDRIPEEDYTFISLQNDYFIYQIIGENGNYNLKKYSLRINSPLKTNYDIGKEEITNSIVINDNLLYAELVGDDTLRYVIIDIDEQKVVKELENSYTVLIGVE